MFERFTPPARVVVVHAQEESRELHHDHIGTSHLLLAVVRAEGAPTTRLLARHGVTHGGLVERVVAASGRGRREPSGHIPFSEHAKAALEQAAYAAEELGQDYVDDAHLLLGLLRVRAARARALLGELGADLDAVSIDAVRAARESEPGPPPAGADPFRDLLAEFRALAAALGRYGRHADGCPGGEACTCGLAGALNRAVGVLGDEPPAP